MSLKQQIMWLFTGFIAFVAGAGALTGYTLHTVKIGSDAYNRIILGKDLVADILPPPEYIIESFLVANEMVNNQDDKTRADYISRFATLEKEFSERHVFWQQQPLDSQLKRLFLAESYTPAIRFYEIGRKELIPAIQQHHEEQARAALNAMRGPYLAHRAAIDAVVQQTTTLNQQEETGINDLVSNLTWVLSLSSLTGTVLGLLILIAGVRQLLAQIGGEPHDAEQVANAIMAGNLRPHSAAQRAASGVLAAMEGMRSQLSRLIGDIQQGADQLSQVAPRLAGQASRSAQDADTQTSSTVQIAAAVEQLSSSITLAAERARDAEIRSREGGDASHKGAAMVSHTVQEMREIASTVGEAAKHVDTLNHQSGEISAIALALTEQDAASNNIASQLENIALMTENASVSAGQSASSAEEISRLAGQLREATSRFQL